MSERHAVSTATEKRLSTQQPPPAAMQRAASEGASKFRRDVELSFSTASAELTNEADTRSWASLRGAVHAMGALRLVCYRRSNL